MTLLVVGLGNPGKKYERNRHNVGFMAVDSISAKWGEQNWRSKFDGVFQSATIDGVAEKIVLLKPTTFMNDSGRSVGQAAKFFQIAPENTIVFYDELDLAPGKVKAKTGGGSAGHNGVKSIVSAIGPDFRRVRMGIGHPGDKARVLGYVLGDFAKSDEVWLSPLLSAIADAAPALAGTDAAFTTALAVAREPAVAAKTAAQRTKIKATPCTEEAKSAGASNPFADALQNLKRET
ncbi:MAG: aminoacyl-tRNA hydrolase [Pseudomonadota bacterium]